MMALLCGVVSSLRAVTRICSENATPQSNVCPLDLGQGLKLSGFPDLFYWLCDKYVRSKRITHVHQHTQYTYYIHGMLINRLKPL